MNLGRPSVSIQVSEYLLLKKWSINWCCRFLIVSTSIQLSSDSCKYSIFRMRISNCNIEFQLYCQSITGMSISSLLVIQVSLEILHWIKKCYLDFSVCSQTDPRIPVDAIPDLLAVCKMRSQMTNSRYILTSFITQI